MEKKIYIDPSKIKKPREESLSTFSEKKRLVKCTGLEGIFGLQSVSNVSHEILKIRI